MLQSLYVRNLGCIDDTVQPISFSQETVLIGPNNSGKSTLLAGLNLLRTYLFYEQLVWDNENYNLHSLAQAVHNHDLDKSINISATLDSVTFDWTIDRQGPSEVQTNNETDPFNEQNQKAIRNIWYFRPSRSLIPHQVEVGGQRSPFQPISPSGSDVVDFLLEKYTEIDPRWTQVEEWFKKIDPEILSIRTKLSHKIVSFETAIKSIIMNTSMHGSGFQSVASIISGVIFSPENSTIIIEEPEICLHKKTQEIVVDLFNDAVNNHGKQIIFSTHSWDMLLPFISDIGRETKRGKQHIHADPSKFTLLAFTKSNGKAAIQTIDLSNMKFADARNYLKKLWS